MLASQRALASAQLNRSTAAEILEAKNPVREAMLESFRRRNTSLDGLFYDIGKVLPDEAGSLAMMLAREGALLIVPPSGSGKVQHFDTVDAFAQQGGDSIQILTVAGVGSTALGSAAFARNVADAFGQPVAAVVSGYGLADLASEALGGWFWFGGLNRLRHQFEILDTMSRPAPPSDASRMSSENMSAESMSGDGMPLSRLSLDTRTVMALLRDPRLRFGLLTGHSKGNLVISEALYELASMDQAVSGDPSIVTVSAAVAMPPTYKKIVDVIGGGDWFGAINCTPGVSIEKRWAQSGHHTNTELPFHLPVTEMFRDLIASGRVTLQ